MLERTKIRRSGFSLIELLVVVGIIGILAGLLLPGLARSKEQAKMTVCLNNLRQLGVSIKLYVDDQNFRYPPNRVLDDDLAPKGTGATLGGYDPIAVQLPYFLRAKRRPLYAYLEPSKVYACPADKGQEPRPCVEAVPPLKPSNFQTIGCSYQYNAGGLTTLRGGGFKVIPEDASGIALKPESWVSNPTRYILMHEPPARIYACPETPYWSQWHYVRGKSDILDPVYARQEFISPILFADGHAASHNFSKSLSTDPYYPYEPTKDWIWYEPAKVATKTDGQ